MLNKIRQLETERLMLIPVSIEHAPQIQKTFPQWEIVKYLSDRVPWPYPDNGAIDFVENIVTPSMEQQQAYYWAIFPKSVPNELIGIINLGFEEGRHRGFWLAPKWHGQGLMSEAAQIVTDFWFDDLGMGTMQIHKAIENTASSNISIKQGMRVIKEEMRKYIAGERLSQTWEITRDEWHARRK